MKDTDILSFKLTGLDGIEKKFEIVPLIRKEANLVFHTAIQSMALAIGESLEAVVAVVSASDDIGGADVGGIVKGVGDGIATVEFEKVWSTAARLFRNAVITSNKPLLDREPPPGPCTIEIGDDFEGIGADYFRDHPDELYTATAKAIDANWPSVFTDARAKIAALRARLQDLLSKGSKK